MFPNIAIAPLSRLGVLFSIAIGATAAHAQDRDHVVLGVGVAVMPVREGADDYRVLPLPAIDIKKGFFFANLRNGVGISPIDNDVVTMGASVVFIQGYRRHDVPDGIDKLSDGVGARIFTNVRAGGFIATIGATKGLSGGTKGVIADASLSYPIPLSPRVSVMPTIATSWSNAKHNDRYFGVTAAESLASGLSQFQAGDGFKDVSAALTASYRLTDRIALSATGTVTTLLGAVKDSPLVVQETRPSGFFTMTYRF